MAWTDMFSQIVSGVSQAGQAVLGYQTQKANLQAAKAQAQAASAAAAQASAPAVSPYAGNAPAPAPTSGGFMSNPLYIAVAALLVLAVGFFALRKG